MGTFQITGPDGKKYKVSGENAEGALAALKKSLGAAPAAPKWGKGDVGNVPEFDPGVEGYNPQTGMVENSKANSFGMGAADVTTFGLGDEIAPYAIQGIEALRGNPVPAYDDLKADIRGQQKQAQADNPKSYLGGQIAGGVAQALAAGPGIAASAPTLAGRALGGAATGAGMGGLYGAGSGEGMEGRAIEGLVGAGTGAVVGGAMPFVARGLGSAWNYLTSGRAANAAAQQAGVQPATARLLADSLAADDTLGARGAANIAAAGPDAMLADAGPSAQRILDTAIQRAGTGGQAAREAIEDRTTRASRSVVDALNQGLGQPQGVTAARTAIREGSAGARQGAYDAAYDAAIDYSAPNGQALEQIIKGRVPGNVINEANRLMRLEGNQSKQILAKVADDGSVTYERLPDVRQIDYITRALNQAAESGEGAGALGGQTTLGRAYQGLSREIRDLTKQAVPEYGQALETAADPIRRSKAVEFGSKLLSPSTTRDQVAEQVAGMTGPEREALAQGVRSRIDDVMANVTRTVRDGNTDAREAIKAIKDISSRANREKVAAVIGDQEAETLFGQLDQAARSFDLRSSVADNSATFARQSMERRIADANEPGIIGTLAQGKPAEAGKKIVQALTGQTKAARNTREERVYSEIVNALTRPAGNNAALLSAIQQVGQSGQAGALLQQRIARALSPSLSYPSSAQAIEYTRGR